MFELKNFGPLRVKEWHQGRRVPVASVIMIGDIEIQALEEPRLLLVPSNVTHLQEMWDALRMPSRNNLLITGESGSGKTTLVRYLGELYREALIRKAGKDRETPISAHAIDRASSFQTRVLTFHENLRRSDITERRHYGEAGEDKTGWTMSDVMDGMAAGDWNVLSEINRTGEDVQAEFNEPLENKAKSLHQRVIRGHPDTRFIATINPVKSEGRGIYEGKVMSGEFINRFTNKVHLDYLPPDQEFEVLKSYGPLVDDPVIVRLVGVATDIRKDYSEEHGVVPFPVTPRALIRIVRHLERFPEDVSELRSLFWRKAYWLDDRIHPPVARNLIRDLLDLHDVTDKERSPAAKSGIIRSGEGVESLRIGDAVLPLGTGGPYVPDTVIEEVQQNLADLEWVLKDIILGENVLLIGEAGVGKNKLESYLAHLLKYNLLVVGMSGETRVSDLLTYRSFGEDEAGKTGDTATLGLRALTDPEQGWLIVLDEANKAHPGVLVSFNDLLQDRLVRMPGGSEVPVRASIFVNVNPNRPPYEVNDFSFEFMDRFSIHPIVHLPADEAIQVLAKKYPEADTDFIRDVVGGYYALHPLYTSGILFEPVTMRNEEAAIERGLQYPDTASNLIDMLSTCYGPRDGRELQAIRGVLESLGFDRNVLAGAGALERFRSSWENDKTSEENALSLAETYYAIGKPSAALDILSEMIDHQPDRNWVYHFEKAHIYLGIDKPAEAGKELRKGFAEGRIIRLDNNEEYRALYSEILIMDGKPVFSVEAINIRMNIPTLIVGEGNERRREFRRLLSEYCLSFRDQTRNIAVYEPVALHREGRRSETGDLCTTSAGIAGRTSLSSLAAEVAMSGWSGAAFRGLLCHLPFPEWSCPIYKEGLITRDIGDGNDRIRLIAGIGGNWAVEVIRNANTESCRVTRRIGWNSPSGQNSGEFFIDSHRGRDFTVQSAVDPFVHLAYKGNDLFLVIRDDIADKIQKELPGGTKEDKFNIKVFLEEQYREEVLDRFFHDMSARLFQIFWYSRNLSGQMTLGQGDIIYTVGPDSGITASVVVRISGLGPVFMGIPTRSPDDKKVPDLWKNYDVLNQSLQHLVIPFDQLDTCEEWLLLATSAQTQDSLKEIRQYAASSLLQNKQPRDLAYEAKARAVLSGLGRTARPLNKGTQLGRGDILIRIPPDSEMPDQSRSVFVVRFLQMGGGHGDPVGKLVVRGFWLAEQNPVATETFDYLSEQFRLVMVCGDEKYRRIIRQLIGALQNSPHQWEYEREGPGSDQAEYLKIPGTLEIGFHPADRRFVFTIRTDDPDTDFKIEETGYPVESTSVTTGSRDAMKWQGTPLVDLRLRNDRDQIDIVLEKDFLSALERSGLITQNPIISRNGFIVQIRPTDGKTKIQQQF